MALQGPDGTLTRVNRALGEMLGYAEAELLGRTHRSLFPADDSPADDWYERDLRSGSIRWYQREQRYQHRDGRLVWGLLSVSAVRDPDGRITDFLIQVQDITERKRAEALESQLRHTQRIEAVGRLAAGVAHDFNNLLMVITGRSHILLHRLPGTDPRRRHVELIQSTALRAGALTRQLLAFSRKAALRPTVLDLNDLVADLAPMLRRLLGEQVLLEAMAVPGLGLVRADRGQIEQVVLNLSVNARDAMPQGGRLALTLADVEVTPEFVAEHPGAHPGRHVAIAVRDSGLGMDAETRARLFEPFFTTKEPGRGTGLGLAMVYGIVKESGGYIDVESQPGRGSTFTVYLPRVDEVVVVQEPRLPAGDLPRGSETVLLVEDEEAVRDLAREILQQAGYTVLGARHGGEALLLGDRHVPVGVLFHVLEQPVDRRLDALEQSGQLRESRDRKFRFDCRVLLGAGNLQPDGGDASIACSENIPFQAVSHHDRFARRNTETVGEMQEDFRPGLANTIHAGNHHFLEKTLQTACHDLLSLQIGRAIRQQTQRICCRKSRQGFESIRHQSLQQPSLAAESLGKVSRAFCILNHLLTQCVIENLFAKAKGPLSELTKLSFPFESSP
jgi:PAS domain S-box-containing protein